MDFLSTYKYLGFQQLTLVRLGSQAGAAVIRSIFHLQHNQNTNTLVDRNCAMDLPYHIPYHVIRYRLCAKRGERSRKIEEVRTFHLHAAVLILQFLILRN